MASEATLAAMLASKQAGIANLAAQGIQSSADPNILTNEGGTYYVGDVGGGGMTPGGVAGKDVTLNPQYVAVGAGTDPAGTLAALTTGGTTAMTIPAIAGTTEVLSGVIGALPELAGALGLPAAVVGAIGAGVGIAQALGYGEGGGLFGNNLLGGDTVQLGPFSLSGPGVPEPSPSVTLKTWAVSYSGGKKINYYLVQKPGSVGKSGRYIIGYKNWTQSYFIYPWRTPSLAIIGKNMPKHKTIVRLRRNLRKHTADAKTLLMLTNPQFIANARAGSRMRRRRH